MMNIESAVPIPERGPRRYIRHPQRTPEQLVDILPIEKNVPVPPRKNRKYPWYEMVIGDSFLVPCAQHEIELVECSITNCRNHAQKKTGWTFITRRTGRGMRVWRVK
jgi:hypothetical protein